MTKETFLQALEKRILLFDGAMGTEIQKLDPKPEDFPDGKDGFNDGLSTSKPEWIKDIHRKYKKKINKQNYKIVTYQIIRDSIDKMIRDLIKNTKNNLKSNKINQSWL